MTPWTFDNIPDQTGRVAIVTGANSGIGLATAEMLARKGAQVVLACRSAEKGRAAVDAILARAPRGTATLQPLDLSDLASIAEFASTFSSTHDRLDLLVNNAGVMVPPLGRTKQGFELQIGTNHLGHFALTARLLPLVAQTPASRIVVVASVAQSAGRIDLDDFNWERRRYDAWAAYAQSKLANMMFALELHRRLAAARSTVVATAAHPGWTSTDIQRTAGITRWFNPLLAMKPSEGALPTLRAATDPDAVSGTYWGPAHLLELVGPPTRARIPRRAEDEAIAARLWELSETLTGAALRA